MAVAKSRLLESLYPQFLDVIPRALVIGGEGSWIDSSTRHLAGRDLRLISWKRIVYWVNNGEERA